MTHCTQFILCLLSITFMNSLVAECGDMTINHSPPTLRFGSADSIYISDLDDLFASALGYTPNNPTSWPGLTVTSPFGYPHAAVVFGVKDAGAPFKMEGPSYELKEDVSLTDTFETLTALIGVRSRRPVHFEKISAFELISNDNASITLPKLKSLKERDPIVAKFLQQILQLPLIADHLLKTSSVEDLGQDVVFVDVDSFAPLVKEFGINSQEVNEASDILRTSLVEAADRVRKFYKDRVVIATVMVARENNHIRRVRAAPTPFGGPVENGTGNLNLAGEYSDDYPVIFNIVVILSIIMIVAIIATSVSMAFMDPGRDSIIYRMTNPRMKKDQ